MTQPNQSNPANEQELDINRIEEIIADHNKAMRADIASEIAGGIRSKAITDVITVKAITAHTNAEIAKVLDRLDDNTVELPMSSGDNMLLVPLQAIQAERAKLKEANPNGTE